MKEQKEVWLKIGDTPYDVSNLGRIRSHRRLGPDGSPTILKPFILGGRYPAVTIGGKNLYVHRLVAKAFLPKGLHHGNQVNHFDDNPLNNNINNLYWGNPAENAIDRKFNQNPERVTRHSSEREAMLDEALSKVANDNDMADDEVLNLVTSGQFVLFWAEK